jgi:hypothetical protein
LENKTTPELQNVDSAVRTDMRSMRATRHLYTASVTESRSYVVVLAIPVGGSIVPSRSLFIMLAFG